MAVEQIALASPPGNQMCPWLQEAAEAVKASHRQPTTHGYSLDYCSGTIALLTDVYVPLLHMTLDKLDKCCAPSTISVWRYL